MDDPIQSATVEVLTARTALLRLLPELAFGGGAGRSTAQRLIRLLTPPDWMMNAHPVSAELAVLIRIADPIIAAGTSDVVDDGGRVCDRQRIDAASLWSAAQDRAWALVAAMNRLAILREAQRMIAAD